MGYLKSISLFSGQDNLGGAMLPQVARASEIESIPVPVNGVIYGDITFKVGGAFYPWGVFASMQSLDNNGRDGPSKKNALAFTIPKDRPDLRDLMKQMEHDVFIILYMENGKQKMFGQLHAPVRFRFAHSSGKETADLNAYDCSFYYQGPDNTFFYEGDIEVAPAGPPPSIVRVNGEVLAALAPGETLNITTDYSFTDYSIAE